MDAVQESKTKPDEAMPVAAPTEEKAVTPAAPAAEIKASPPQPKRDANAVPKPQLGMPQFRNRPQGTYYFIGSHPLFPTLTSLPF